MTSQLANSLQDHLRAEQEKARNVYELAVVAEAHGEKPKAPSKVLEALSTLNLTMADFERAVAVERQYLKYASIAGDEEQARTKMHEAAKECEKVLVEIEVETKRNKERAREAKGLYDAARRELAIILDASNRLSKINSIQGRAYAEKLRVITDAQKQCGRDLESIREALTQERINQTRIQGEHTRTQDEGLRQDYALSEKRVVELSAQERHVIAESERLNREYEIVRRSGGSTSIADEIADL